MHSRFIAIALLLLSSAMLSGCGVVNNLNAARKNLTTLVTPHPYSFAEKDRQAVLDSGKAIVSLNVKPSVRTVWKKIEADGSISKENFMLTYIEGLFDGRRESQLEAGTYFLDGMAFAIDNIYYRSGSEANTLSNKIFGWDAENKQAECFSFTLAPGEELFIPDITVTPDYNKDYSYKNREQSHICHRMEVKDDPKKRYQVGPKSQNQSYFPK